MGRNKISSYQKLKVKNLKLIVDIENIKEDIEALILYPHSKRAKSIRQEIRERQDG